MKNNSNDLKQDAMNLKSYKAKYFLIGFIVGIIPYIILIMLFNNSITWTKLIYFKEILVIIGICTAFTNAFVLESKVNKRYAEILQINKGVKINS